MKKLICLLSVALLLTACAETPTPSTTAAATATTSQSQDESVYYNRKWDGKSMKILCVGNSFARNATKYLYQIAAAEGVEEIIIGVLHIGGCTVERHYNNAQSGESAYTYYKNTTGQWESTESVSLEYGLQDEAWDVITITQGQGLYGIPSSYDVFLPGLIEYINEKKLNPEAQLAFHLIWAFPPDCPNDRFNLYAQNQEVMFESICSTAHQLLQNYPELHFLLPSGTAVQNARQALGEVFVKDDGFHLNSYGEYVAGYIWYASLTGNHITSLKYIPDGIGITRSAHEHIINAVNAALDQPLAVTPLE